MRVVVAVALLLTVLSGCSGNDTPSNASDVPLGDDIEVTVTETTGAIRGVVVDEAIVPLANVEVLLRLPEGDQTATTTASGGFAFSGLPEGTYFLQATKFGYSSAQQSAEVRAGDRDPPAVKIVLARDAAQRAYFIAQQFTGFIVCTTSVVAVCGAPNVVSNVLLCGLPPPLPAICLGNVTDDRFGWDFFYEPNASYIQSELFWKSTQPLSTEFSLQMETIQGCDAEYYENTESGNSPLMNFATGDEIAAAEIGGECSIFHSIFSGETGGTPAGFTFQQQFEAYTHAFYGYLPPEGWRFSVDGDPPIPR